MELGPVASSKRNGFSDFLGFFNGVYSFWRFSYGFSRVLKVLLGVFHDFPMVFCTVFLEFSRAFSL